MRQRTHPSEALWQRSKIAIFYPLSSILNGYFADGLSYDAGSGASGSPAASHSNRSVTPTISGSNG